jgi:hypothetical protein
MKPIWVKVIAITIAALVLATISTCRSQQQAREITGSMCGK